MTKQHKINLGISVLFLCILIWLYLEIDAKKKAVALHQADKDQLEKDLLGKEQGMGAFLFVACNKGLFFIHAAIPYEADRKWLSTRCQRSLIQQQRKFSIRWAPRLLHR